MAMGTVVLELHVTRRLRRTTCIGLGPGCQRRQFAVPMAKDKVPVRVIHVYIPPRTPDTEWTIPATRTHDPGFTECVGGGGSGQDLIGPSYLLRVVWRLGTVSGLSSLCGYLLVKLALKFMSVA
jgi:hypothetical protein